MRRRTVFPTLVAAALLAVTATAHAQSPADAEAAIRLQSERFSQAYVNEDFDTLIGIYATDAMAAPSGRDFIRGREALRAYWTVPEGVDVTHHRATPERLVVDGRHAYDWGRYEGASGPAGARRPFGGKYLITWVLDDDGVWRIANDMWNSVAPPNPAR
jgi:ketosteroid isomerase-like protein